MMSSAQDYQSIATAASSLRMSEQHTLPGTASAAPMPQTHAQPLGPSSEVGKSPNPLSTLQRGFKKERALIEEDFRKERQRQEREYSFSSSQFHLWCVGGGYGYKSTPVER